MFEFFSSFFSEQSNVFSTYFRTVSEEQFSSSSLSFSSNFKSTSLALNLFKDKIVFFLILNHQWRCYGGIHFSVARYRRLANGKWETVLNVLNIYDCFILTQKSIAKMLLWGINLSIVNGYSIKVWEHVKVKLFLFSKNMVNRQNSRIIWNKKSWFVTFWFRKYLLKCQSLLWEILKSEKDKTDEDLHQM